MNGSLPQKSVFGSEEKVFLQIQRFGKLNKRDNSICKKKCLAPSAVTKRTVLIRMYWSQSLHKFEFNIQKVSAFKRFVPSIFIVFKIIVIEDTSTTIATTCVRLVVSFEFVVCNSSLCHHNFDGHQMLDYSRLRENSI